MELRIHNGVIAVEKGMDRIQSPIEPFVMEAVDQCIDECMDGRVLIRICIVKLLMNPLLNLIEGCMGLVVIYLLMEFDVIRCLPGMEGGVLGRLIGEEGIQVGFLLGVEVDMHRVIIRVEGGLLGRLIGEELRQSRFLSSVESRIGCLLFCIKRCVDCILIGMDGVMGKMETRMLCILDGVEIGILARLVRMKAIVRGMKVIVPGRKGMEGRVSCTLGGVESGIAGV